MADTSSRKPTSGPGNPGPQSKSTSAMVPVRARRGSALARAGLEVLPAIVTRAGEDTARRFLEFFTANIRNRNTRAAYGKAVGRFLTWCDEGGFELEDIEPMVVAAYVEQLTQEYSAPTVKQHLAAIRMLFDWMVTGGKLPMNPAASVRGPKHVVKTGKTPVLDADQARKLLDAIPDPDPDSIRARFANADPTEAR